MTTETNAPVTVRDDAVKGRCLHATMDLQEGVTVFQDTPLLCAQYLHNKDYYPACDHCLRPLEKASVHLARLVGALLPTNPVNPSQWHLDGEENLLTPDTHLCSCGEKYCSNACQQQAWNTYHEILCPGTRSDAPIINVRQYWKSIHFPPESASIDLLLKIMAFIVNQMRNGTSFEMAMQTFSSFACQYVNESENAVLAFLEPSFQKHLETLHSLVVQCFPIHDSLFIPLLTRERFNQFLALICINGQGIGTSSLEQYISYLNKTPEKLFPTETQNRQSSVQQQLDSLQDEIEEHSGEFTHCEGTGLYRLHSLLNHSCRANCKIVFERGDAVLSVVTKRAIAMGEELTICYIEEEDEQECESDEECKDDCNDCDQKFSVQERREMLRRFYLFDCQCERCLEENV